MREEHRIERQVLHAQTDQNAADELIRQYLPFIKAETAKFIKRIPLEGHDEELSVAMFAFYEAMLSYQRGRGAFLKLASVSIRNRLIDYARKEQRHTGTVSLDTPVSDGENSRTLLDETESASHEIEEHYERSAAREEILEFASQLSAFGLSLSDVADSCPKQERTLHTCMLALAYAKENPALLEQMVANRKLPLVQLSMGAGLERKTLERHRKYLVAILLAYTNGFEIIRGHLRQIKRKEGPQA
jgi:RNA polymerase sigma factor